MCVVVVCRERKFFFLSFATAAAVFKLSLSQLKIERSKAGGEKKKEGKASERAAAVSPKNQQLLYKIP